jgi:hypothetical protein
MAEGGQAQRLLGQVTGELRRFAEDGQERWRTLGGRSQLPGIEGLIRSQRDLDPGDRLQAALVCGAIREACESLDEDWRQTAWLHLGFAPGSAPSRIAREDEAARELRVAGPGGVVGRTYRATIGEERHKGRPFDGNTYDSWSEVTLVCVAGALIQQCGGNPDAPVEGGESGESEESDEPGVRRLGDVVRAEVSALYRPLRAEDFDKSFFHRASTDAYIEDLASLAAVTLYTGGAVSTEVQAPLSDTLVASALTERLRYASPEFNDRQRKRVVKALMHAYPPARLGSIARELVRQQSDRDPQDVDALEEDAQRIFVSEFQDALTAGHTTGGFLALGIGALAFSLRKAGRDPVRVLTTSYDDRISQTEGQVREYFGDLEGYRFDPRPLESPERADDDDAIPLYRLNGHVRGDGAPTPLIVGEADALTRHYQGRSDLVEQALTESACIFIGTDLDEPDVLSKLVAAPCPEGLPRYAIVLPPELDLDSEGERAKVLNLAAQRFLHLGVMPILIDFPHQVPQFLIEVALRLQQGRNEYRNYATRLQTWWNAWAKQFGFAVGGRGTPGRRDLALQEAWRKELEKIRQVIVRDHLQIPGGEDGRGEQIEIEVWIRQPNERSLILWSTSDGLWLNPHTADRCYIYKGEDIPVQRAFREGTPVFGRVDPQRGEWRYQLSIPLVLRKHPWHHLPVGVVNILSSMDPPREDDDGDVVAPGGKLGGFQRRTGFAADLATLTSAAKKPINALLDPGSPHWQRKKRSRR